MSSRSVRLSAVREWLIRCSMCALARGYMGRAGDEVGQNLEPDPQVQHEDGEDRSGEEDYHHGRLEE